VLLNTHSVLLSNTHSVLLNTHSVLLNTHSVLLKASKQFKPVSSSRTCRHQFEVACVERVALPEHEA
jgi:hypothetical protein